MLVKSLAILLLPIMASGCVVVDDRRTDEMPNGVTLLETEKAECYGPLEFQGDPDVVVGDGEDATFEVVDADDIDWQCLADGGREEGELNCPDDTRYVRVTRGEEDDDFTMECFGA